VETPAQNENGAAHESPQPKTLADALAGRVGRVSFAPDDGSERVEEL
jgi:hypothetical protein